MFGRYIAMNLLYLNLYILLQFTSLEYNFKLALSDYLQNTLYNAKFNGVEVTNPSDLFYT